MSTTLPQTAEQAVRPALTLHANDRRCLTRALSLLVLAVVLAVVIAGIGTVISYRSLAGRLLLPAQAAAVAFCLHGAITLLVHFLHTMEPDARAEPFVKAGKVLLWALGAVLVLVALARIPGFLETHTLLSSLALTLGLFLIEMATPFVAGLLTGHAHLHVRDARDEEAASATLVSDLCSADALNRGRVWSQHLSALRDSVARIQAQETISLAGALREAERLRRRLETRRRLWSASCPFPAERSGAEGFRTTTIRGERQPAPVAPEPSDVSWKEPGFVPNGVPPHRPGGYAQPGPENYLG